MKFKNFTKNIKIATTAVPFVVAGIVGISTLQSCHSMKKNVAKKEEKLANRCEDLQKRVDAVTDKVGLLEQEAEQQGERLKGVLSDAEYAHQQINEARDRIMKQVQENMRSHTDKNVVNFNG